MATELYLLVDTSGFMERTVTSLPCTLRQVYLFRDTVLPGLKCRVVTYGSKIHCYDVDADPSQFAGLKAKGGPVDSTPALLNVLGLVSDGALVVHYVGARTLSDSTALGRLATAFRDFNATVCTYCCDGTGLAYAPLGVILPMADNISRETMCALRAHFQQRLTPMRKDIALFRPFVNTADLRLVLYNDELQALWRIIRVQRTPDAAAIRTDVAACADPDVSNWIIRTFSHKDEIEYVIDSADSPTPFLVVRGARTDARSAILSLSKAPRRDTLAAVQDILVHLVTCTGAPPTDYQFIPFSVDEADFFAMIPHLVVPDIMYDTRPAALVALMVYQNEDRASLLSCKAAAFLEKIRGTWLKMDDTDTPAFVRFIAGMPFLTSTETAYFTARATHFDVEEALLNPVVVQVQWSPARGDYIETELAVCVLCNNVDTITTMEDETCIACRVPTVTREVSPSGTRFMARCSRCQCLYGIARPSQLKCVPTCHWCRNGIEVNRVKCYNCKISYIKPDAHENDTRFRCRVCPPNKRVKTTVGALCVENKALLSGKPEGLKLTVLGQQIVSCHDNLFKRGSTPTCAMCFQETESMYMQSACGHCSKLACALCLDGWYGQVVPGEPVTPAHLRCPFCRRHPKAATLRRFNREASFIRHDDVPFKPHIQYGWCRHCYMVKPWGIGAVCVECAPRMLDVAPTSPCPSCKTDVTNVGGADHVVCVCGTSFCWKCRFEAEEVEDILDHVCMA